MYFVRRSYDISYPTLSLTKLTPSSLNMVVTIILREGGATEIYKEMINVDGRWVWIYHRR